MQKLTTLKSLSKFRKQQQSQSVPLSAGFHCHNDQSFGSCNDAKGYQGQCYCTWTSVDTIGELFLLLLLDLPIVVEQGNTSICAFRWWSLSPKR